MNFNVPSTAANDSFEDMEALNVNFNVDGMPFPGPGAWDTEGENLMLGGFEGGGRVDMGRG